MLACILVVCFYPREMRQHFPFLLFGLSALVFNHSWSFVIYTLVDPYIIIIVNGIIEFRGEFKRFQRLPHGFIGKTARQVILL